MGANTSKRGSYTTNEKKIKKPKVKGIERTDSFLYLSQPRSNLTKHNVEFYKSASGLLYFGVRNFERTTLRKSKSMIELSKNKNNLKLKIGDGLKNNQSMDDLYSMDSCDDGKELNDIINKLKLIRKSIKAYDGSQNVKEIKSNLDSCLVDLNKINSVKPTIMEIRGAIGEKIKSYKQAISEKEYKNNKSKPVSASESPHVLHFKSTFVKFEEITAKLNQLKENIIEYYGTSEDSEYQEIVKGLHDCSWALNEIDPKGNFRIVVSKEEYEDYVQRILAQFENIVRDNEKNFQLNKEQLSVIDRRRDRRKRSQVMEMNYVEPLRDDDEDSDDESENEIIEEITIKELRESISDVSLRSRSHSVGSDDQFYDCFEEIPLAEQIYQQNNLLLLNQNLIRNNHIKSDNFVDTTPNGFADIFGRNTFDSKFEDEIVDDQKVITDDKLDVEENINAKLEENISKENEQIKEIQIKETKIEEDNTKNKQIKVQQIEEDQIEEKQIKESKIVKDNTEETQINVQQIKEKQIEENQIKETKIKEDNTKDKQIKVQQIKEEQIEENQIKETKIKEDNTKDKQIKVQQIKEEQIEEKQIKETKIEEDNTKDKQIKVQQIKEEQIEEKQIKESKIVKDNTEEKQINVQQIKEKQIEENQIKEIKIKENNTEEKQIKEEQIKEKQIKETKIAENNLNQLDNNNLDQNDLKKIKDSLMKLPTITISDLSKEPDTKVLKEEVVANLDNDFTSKEGIALFDQKSYEEVDSSFPSDAQVEVIDDKIDDEENRFVVLSNGEIIKIDHQKMDQLIQEEVIDNNLKENLNNIPSSSLEEITDQKIFIEELSKLPKTKSIESLDSIDKEELDDVLTDLIVPPEPPVSTELTQITECVGVMKQCIDDFEGGKDDENYSSILENLYDSMMILNKVKSTSADIIKEKQKILAEISKCIGDLQKKAT